MNFSNRCCLVLYIFLLFVNDFLTLFDDVITVKIFATSLTHTEKFQIQRSIFAVYMIICDLCTTTMEYKGHPLCYLRQSERYAIRAVCLWFCEQD